MDTRAAPLVLLLTGLALGAELAILYSGDFSADIHWLAPGLGKDLPGSPSGKVSPGSPNDPHLTPIQTYRDHTFRLRGANRWLSSSFAHDGAPMNVVMLADAHLVGDVSGSNDPVAMERLGGAELQLMMNRAASRCKFGVVTPSQVSACVRGSEIRSPVHHMLIPAPVVMSVWKHFSPSEIQPKLLQMIQHSGYTPDDRVVVLNRAPYAVQVRWMWLGTEQDNPLLLGEVPAATGPGEPGTSSIIAQPLQQFLFSSPSGQSDTVLYSGEMLLVHTVDSTVPGSTVTKFAANPTNEDALKVQLSGHAHYCSDTTFESDTWWACVAKGLGVSPELANDWFNVLWQSTMHWQLCNRQPPSPSIKTIEVQLSDRKIRADVIRTSPLVMVLHEATTADECDHLEELGMDGLGMAHVAGGGHSRGRRTLAKNLNPDLTNRSSLLTQLQERFMAIAREATGFELYAEGQEPVNFLYYHPGYEYRPHCDGGCSFGNTVPLRQRVATSLLYCRVPEEGGATVFTKGKILKVQPAKGMMLLFSYNPDPGGISEHSACPVLRGNKSTATQWYREGVSLESDWEGNRVERDSIERGDIDDNNSEEEGEEDL